MAPLLVACVGCAGVHTKTPEGAAVTMDEQRFGEYVERVFRHHNAVVNELLFSAAAQDDRVSALGQAETRMALACLPLNEVVSASALGQSTSFWARMTLSQAVPDCEAATRVVESLMKAPR
jgi:uncharacterized metal-binding protein